MLLVLIFAFLNSVGVFAMWLLLGPFYSSIIGGISAFGFIGMLRQFAGTAGNLASGSFVDSGAIFRKHLRAEVVVLLLCLGFLVLFLGNKDVAVSLIPHWVIVRFFIASLSFVFFFKVLALATNELGKSSITQMFVSQGATIIAPLAAAGISFFYVEPFLAALIFDIVTSIVYVAVLVSKIGTQLDVRAVSEGETEVLYRDVWKTMTCIFSRHLFPWNAIQLLLLAMLSGYFVWVLDISRHQTYLDADIFFPLITVFYGIALWTTGLFLNRLGDSVKCFSGSVLLGMLSGALLFVPNIVATILSFLIYVFAFWGSLHSSNKILLDMGTQSTAGRLRASMVFYLAVFFGIGEYVFGILFDLEMGSSFLAFSRIGLGIIILLLVVAYGSRSENSESH